MLNKILLLLTVSIFQILNASQIPDSVLSIHKSKLASFDVDAPITQQKNANKLLNQQTSSFYSLFTSSSSIEKIDTDGITGLEVSTINSFVYPDYVLSIVSTVFYKEGLIKQLKSSSFVDNAFSSNSNTSLHLSSLDCFNSSSNGLQPDNSIFKKVNSLIPYGIEFGDSVLKGDDECSELISLKNPLYFETSHWDGIYACVNGFVSNQVYNLDFFLDLNLSIVPLISPLLADFLTQSNMSSVFYRQTNDELILDQISTTIKNYNQIFEVSLSSAFVATWKNVSFFNSKSSMSTFQLVIATTYSCKSFILFLYDSLKIPANILNSLKSGYTFYHNYASYKSISLNEIGSLLNSSTSLPKAAVFEIQSEAVDCPTTTTSTTTTSTTTLPYMNIFKPVSSLIPYGDDVGDNYFNVYDCYFFNLNSFIYFDAGSYWDYVYICADGFISRQYVYPTIYEALNVTYLPIIGPLIADMTFFGSGKLFYRQSDDYQYLNQIKLIINSYYPGQYSEMSLSSALIVTWSNSSFSGYPSTKNTFQLVAATTSNCQTFVLFLYESLSVPSTLIDQIQAGYSLYSSYSHYQAIDLNVLLKINNYSSLLPLAVVNKIYNENPECPLTTTTSTTSPTTVPLDSIFKHVNSLLPYGELYGDQSFTGDEYCEFIYLQSFIYFDSGSYWDSIYACTNGYVSKDYSTQFNYPPLNETNFTMIGALIADLKTYSNSYVYYRQSKDSKTLNDIKLIINNYFPDQYNEISLSSALIVTWYDISFYNFLFNKNSFQLVLTTTDKCQTFVLFLYEKLDVPASFLNKILAGFSLYPNYSHYQAIDLRILLNMNGYSSLLPLAVVFKLYNEQGECSYSTETTFETSETTETSVYTETNVYTETTIPLEPIFKQITDLLPFGSGQILQGDDTCSDRIFLNRMFYYDLNNLWYVYICTNGLISSQNFTQTSFPSFSESSIFLIGPLISDFKTYSNSFVYYHQTQEPGALNEIKFLIKNFYPGVYDNISLDSALVVTWDQVSFYSYEEDKNTFQLVLTTTNECKSFIILLYKNLSIPLFKRNNFQAGYTFGNGISYKSIDSSKILFLESNPNLLPVYIVFPVDSSPNYCDSTTSLLTTTSSTPTTTPFTLFKPIFSVLKYGTIFNDYILTNNSIKLNTAFEYGGKKINEFFVCNNGFISSNNNCSASFNSFNSSDVNIAPLYYRSFLLNEDSAVYYREINGNSSDMDTIFTLINDLRVEYLNQSEIEWALVITWHNLLFLNRSYTNTFQLVLLSDSNCSSHALFLYENVSVPLGFESELKIGNVYERNGQFSYFNDWYSNYAIELVNDVVEFPKGVASAISKNCRDDSPKLNPASNTLDYGVNEGDGSLSGDDLCSEPLYLNKFFYYANTSLNKIYVCTNGLVSGEDSDNSFYDELSKSNKILIGPLISDLVTLNDSFVFYRQTEDVGILNKIMLLINSSYPALYGNESLSSALIVTWDKVSFYGDESNENTFQLVLTTTESCSSFILFFYKNLSIPLSNVNQFQAGYTFGLRENFYSIEPNDLLYLDQNKKLLPQYIVMPVRSQGEICAPLSSTTTTTTSTTTTQPPITVFKAIPSLLPYGFATNDSALDLNNNTKPIYLKKLYPYNGKNYDSIFVCNNGFVSAVDKCDNNATRFSYYVRNSVIAPLYSENLNIIESSKIFQRQIGPDSSSFDSIFELMIRLNLTGLNKSDLDWAMVITWENIWALGSLNTFQLVLISDSNCNLFALFLYANVSLNLNNFQIMHTVDLNGYTYKDNFEFYFLSDLNTLNRQTVGLGRQIRTRNACAGLTLLKSIGSLISYGTSQGDYYSSSPIDISLNKTFTYEIDSSLVNASLFYATPSSELFLINFDVLYSISYNAMYSTYYDNSLVGFYSRQTRSRSDLASVEKMIKTYYPNQYIGLSLDWALVMTWSELKFLNYPDQKNTFQAILASTQNCRLFWLFLYNDINIPNGYLSFVRAGVANEMNLLESVFLNNDIFLLNGSPKMLPKGFVYEYKSNLIKNCSLAK